MLSFAIKKSSLCEISNMDKYLDLPRSTRAWMRPATASVCLAIWFAVLCFLPDPRPLSAPELAVKTIRSLSGLSEPISRALASVSLRVLAFVLLGILTSSGLGGVSARTAILPGLLLAPSLAVLCQWINFGYFPVAIQLKVSIPSAIVGALVGFALRGGRFALVVLVVIAALVVGLFLWGTSNNVSQDLDFASRQTVNHVLAHADEIRPGNEGFVDAVQLAFDFAEDNSHGRDPVQANKAAILALGIIFGDDKIARVAQSELEPEWRDRIESLRQRVTLRGRGDTPRHFWVSAALVVITDETRATAVGVGKELLDSNPGGSGFSFVDLGANRAGILFALAATRDAASARATQLSIVRDGLHAEDYCPKIEDLPEGLTRDQFQAEYGGLGGDRTRELRAEIERRMATKAVLRLGG
jgi:hypothetical protein